MKKLFFVLALGLLMGACSKESENTMYVNTKVLGLKKGKFYLQKQQDSLLVVVDSITVSGHDEFLLSDDIESPEMYYLSMKNSKKGIPFFGEKDTISILTKLDNFEFNAKIKGSDNQDRLEKYLEIKSRFSNQNLDYQKALIEAKMANNLDSAAVVQKQIDALTRRRYLYAINYAINNKDYEVAPYIALTELVDAQSKWLDTVYNSLTPKIKSSKYGVNLDDFLKKIKEVEAK